MTKAMEEQLAALTPEQREAFYAKCKTEMDAAMERLSAQIPWVWGGTGPSDGPGGKRVTFWEALREFEKKYPGYRYGSPPKEPK